MGGTVLQGSVKPVLITASENNLTQQHETLHKIINKCDVRNHSESNLQLHRSCSIIRNLLKSTLCSNDRNA